MVCKCCKCMLFSIKNLKSLFTKNSPQKWLRISLNFLQNTLELTYAIFEWVLVIEKRLSFSFWIPKTGCFSNEILKINVALYGSGLQNFWYFAKLKRQKVSKSALQYHGKNKTEHPRSQIFFIFDPERNVCGPKSQLISKAKFSFEPKNQWFFFVFLP